MVFCRKEPIAAAIQLVNKLIFLFFILARLKIEKKKYNKSTCSNQLESNLSLQKRSTAATSQLGNQAGWWRLLKGTGGLMSTKKESYNKQTAFSCSASKHQHVLIKKRLLWV